MKHLILALTIWFCAPALAQVRSLPSLPSSGGAGLGLQGSAGVGFADYSVQSPEDDLRIDRGMFLVGSLERGFNVLHLYLTLTLSHMTAEGLSNYSYQNLTSSVTYTAQDVKFKSSITDLGLGIKLKIIDNYWFRPYVEGGGLGGYHQISYSTGHDVLAAQGSDYKTKDVVMGSGYYGEGGVEAMFGAKFGVKLAARQSTYQTKKMETFGNRPLRFITETYYFSVLFGM